MVGPTGIIKTRACAVLVACILVCCAGCGTMVNGMFGTPKPYAGVRGDINAIGEGGGGICLVLDLPFSAVADTVLLFPVDLPNAPPISDPLKGWKPLGWKAHPSYPFDEAITRDLALYIAKQKLPIPPSDHDIGFYEDATGRHAVRFEVSFNGYRRVHILIYNKSNVRAKSMKFITGRYMC